MIDFINIEESNFTYKIDDKIIDLINLISKEVSSPEYIKTPQFNKQNYKRNKNKDYINNLNWNVNKNFQKTELIKKQGIDSNIDNIRKNLNKMTIQTYDILKKNIIAEINLILEIKNSDQNKLNDLNKIGDAIFTLASSNVFFSEMYATLYYDLMEQFQFMKDILKDNYNKFNILFNNIKYCDPNTDYDKFCENNKINEERKAVSSFYVHLLQKKVIDIESFSDIILNIQNNMLKYIDEDNKKEILDELSEIIFVLVSNSIELLKTNSLWDTIYNNIIYISKIKIKTRPSISNKTIFKHMDLLDII